ncbi:integrase arm-type DNA-binding domain-containing protein [Methylobacterium sp. J-026]|uniref:tyrosine-type recombinase/integrase n=1 Tax=Methylobacterium sp. J-026 TaxID=2836624 RepID=UPI001FB948DE|nr:site-specific integrase [Methylobacterium sp. J-026]MCJ2137442.1 integrase arm-type DNA-binding domain-containing protein [Methylobacterium sp. J-026]
MGGKGRHPEKALTTVQVRALKSPGRYADGHGLYLVVDPSGAKRWLLRIVVQGHRRDIGLGGAGLVSLAEAREKALTYRKTARDGGDPLAERAKARATIPTFAEAAELVHAEHKATWKNPKHAAQWITTLRTYANPHLGAKRVDLIETPDVLRALSPIWLTKGETARRVRQRIGTVLDWAKAAGHRSGDNPVDGVVKGLPKQSEHQGHHAAQPYAEVPAFVARLRAMSGQGEVGRIAFEFLILTAARTSEVLGANWSEINKAEALWTVPAARMKAGREHRVPLSERAREVLARARELGGGSALVFPGRAGDRPLSNMVFLMALRRMGASITAHGFRSSFRDWAAEATNLPREVAEMALAHTIENRVEAAYRRGDLLEKRRELMELWGSFCDAEYLNAS